MHHNLKCAFRETAGTRVRAFAIAINDTETCSPVVRKHIPSLFGAFGLMSADFLQTVHQSYLPLRTVQLQHHFPFLYSSIRSATRKIRSLFATGTAAKFFSLSAYHFFCPLFLFLHEQTLLSPLFSYQTFRKIFYSLDPLCHAGSAWIIFGNFAATSSYARSVMRPVKSSSSSASGASQSEPVRKYSRYKSSSPPHFCDPHKIFGLYHLYPEVLAYHSST